MQENDQIVRAIKSPLEELIRDLGGNPSDYIKEPLEDGDLEFINLDDENEIVSMKGINQKQKNQKQSKELKIVSFLTKLNLNHGFINSNSQNHEKTFVEKESEKKSEQLLEGQYQEISKQILEQQYDNMINEMYMMDEIPDQLDMIEDNKETADLNEKMSDLIRR